MDHQRVIDLSHPIRAGLTTYPGLPAPSITAHMTHEQSRSHYAEGTEFAMGIITMIGNTGTYLDSPFHRYPDGPDLAGLDLTTLVGLRAEVFHLADGWDADHRGIGPDALAGRDLSGAAVLVRTDWSRHFGTEAYGHGAPFLTGDAADHLVAAGATLVGIDSLNIDDTEGGGERPVHTRAARGRDPRGRAPDQPGGRPGQRRAVHGGAAGDRGLRHVPGAGVRHGLTPRRFRAPAGRATAVKPAGRTLAP